jgi:hypothetical protein
MVTTLVTVLTNSIAGLAWLSPLEVIAAAGALSVAVGGLTALHTSAPPSPSDVSIATTPEPTYKSAA